jgi:hypothetical protein
LRLIIPDEPLEVESLKKWLDWFKQCFPEQGINPVLFVVPELKFKAKELVHGTDIPFAVFYRARSDHFWAIGDLKYVRRSKRS